MKSRKMCTPTAGELQALYEAPSPAQAQARTNRGPITQVELWLLDILSWTECSTPGYQYEKLRRGLLALRRSGPKTELEAKLIPAVTDILFKEQTKEEYDRCREVANEAENTILGMAACGAPIEAGEFLIIRSICKGEEDHLHISERDRWPEDEYEVLPLPVVSRSQWRSANREDPRTGLNRCFSNAALALDTIYEAAIAGDAGAERCLRSLARKIMTEGSRF